MSCVALLALVPMSLEGVTAGTSFAREASASQTRIVHASADAVERALFEVPRFDRALPAFLGAGFPRPNWVRIDGNTWVIRMRGGEMRLDGMEPREGDLVLDVDARRPGMVQWNARSDDSHMTHFLSWQSARVEWEAIDAGTTRVTWTLRLPPRPGSGVVLRADGTIRRTTRGRLPDRHGRDTMIIDDRYLIVRAASVYIAVMLLALAWGFKRPRGRVIAGALLASLWNVPVLLALHVLADRAGWWRFDAEGGLLLGMPVDLLIAWACLWGAVPALALSSWPLAAVVALALAADLVLMPAASPVVQLGPSWLTGEFAGLALGLLPAQLLARWTARDEHLAWRATLQVFAFTGLMLFVLPAAIIEGSGSRWIDPFARPTWQLSLLVQLLAVPALFGLTAVQEFATARRRHTGAIRRATPHGDDAACTRMSAIRCSCRRS